MIVNNKKTTARAVLPQRFFPNFALNLSQFKRINLLLLAKVFGVFRGNTGELIRLSFNHKKSRFDVVRILCRFTKLHLLNPVETKVLKHTGTSQFICSTNILTGFYIMEILNS